MTEPNGGEIPKKGHMGPGGDLLGLPNTKGDEKEGKEEIRRERLPWLSWEIDSESAALTQLARKE